MKTKILLPLLLLVVVSALAGWRLNGDANREASTKINWMSFEEAVAKNKKQPRKMVIDVYTDWCGWCKKMDASTFSDVQIAEYVNNNYYPVKLDAEMRDTVIFDERAFTFVVQNPTTNRGFHQLAASLLDGKMSYPSIVVLDEQFNRIGLVASYMDIPTFDRMIKYYGGNYHKTTPFEDFAKAYKSPY